MQTPLSSHILILEQCLFMAMTEIIMEAVVLENFTTYSLHAFSHFALHGNVQLVLVDFVSCNRDILDLKKTPLISIN